MSSPKFRFIIDDTFSLKERGLVAAGKVDWGTLRAGQRVQIESSDGSERYEAQIKGIEHIQKPIEIVLAVENVAVLLSGVTKDQIKRGMIMTPIS